MTDGAENSDNWAANREHLEVVAPEGAVDPKLTGRKLSGALQGFGQMWQKTYQVRLDGADTTPERVITEWKANYGEFWPDNNHFYAPIAGLKPGEVGVINTSQGPMTLSTGVMVLYADDRSFTYMTPEGHVFAGWVTFSSHEDHDGVVIAQVQLLIRASDPVFELAFKLGAGRMEDRIWQHTLRSVARHFDVDDEPTTEIVCVDKRRQWKNFGNVRLNLALRSMGRSLLSPVRKR